MSLKVRDLESVLLGKFDFYVDERDHKWFCLNVEGLPAIKTKVSHGSGGSEIYPKLEGKIRRQLRVRKKFFDGMIECPNDLEAYIEKLRTDPFPPFNVRF